MENTKLTVSDFVGKYEACHLPQEKADLWAGIGLRTYVPYSVKAKIATEIIRNHFMTEYGTVLRNAPLLYVLNRMCTVELYCPGLRISSEDALADYDLLMQSGALADIMGMIGKDVSEFDAVFHMTYTDLIENTSTPQAFVNRLVEEMTKLLDSNSDALTDILQKVNSAS
ncbi:hypothetical protein D7Y05_09350 [bacterium 1XD42-54]|nr:hypothetical protein D7Y05_09350 [bacterium 1XD42-54]